MANPGPDQVRLPAEQCWATARGFDLKAPHWDDLDADIRDTVRRAIDVARASVPPTAGRSLSAEPKSVVSILAELQLWVEETDGYLTIVHTVAGGWTLGCGREVGIPSDFTPECPHTPPADAWGQSEERDKELLALSMACDCPDAGWVAEFSAHGVREGAEFPLDHFVRVHEFGLTFDAAVIALYQSIKRGKVCQCVVPPKLTLDYEWERKIERLDEEIVAKRKGEPTATPQDAFDALVESILAAVEEGPDGKRFTRGLLPRRRSHDTEEA